MIPAWEAARYIRAVRIGFTQKRTLAGNETDVLPVSIDARGKGGRPANAELFLYLARYLPTVGVRVDRQREIDDATRNLGDKPKGRGSLPAWRDCQSSVPILPRGGEGGGGGQGRTGRTVCVLRRKRTRWSTLLGGGGAKLHRYSTAGCAQRGYNNSIATMNITSPLYVFFPPRARRRLVFFSQPRGVASPFLVEGGGEVQVGWNWLGSLQSSRYCRFSWIPLEFRVGTVKYVCMHFAHRHRVLCQGHFLRGGRRLLLGRRKYGFGRYKSTPARSKTPV